MTKSHNDDQPNRQADKADSRSESAEHLKRAQNEATDSTEDDVAATVRKQRHDRKNRVEGKPTDATENFGYRPELVDGDKQLIPGWKKGDSNQQSDQTSEAQRKDSKIAEYTPQQLSDTKFALGLDYEESPKDTALTTITAVGDKLSGALEGVTQAVQEGVQNWAQDSNATNKALAATGEAIANAAEYYANKIANGDLKGFANDLAQAGDAISEASKAYSELSANEQGRIIGHDFMPAFLPDAPGVLSELKTLGKAPEVMKAARAVSEKFDPGTGFIRRASGELDHYLEKLPESILKEKMPQNIHPPVEYTRASESRDAGRAIDRMYHPGGKASTAFVDTIYKALNSLPADDIKAVEQAGWRVRADKTIADIDSKIAKYKESPTDSSNEYSLGLTVPRETPRSFWPGDKTRHAEIMLPEYAQLPTGEWISQLEKQTVDYVTRHEFGHAYADLKGMEKHGGLYFLYQQCKGAAFKEWESIRLKGISLSDQEVSRTKELNKIYSYLHPKDGYSETLAELYAIEHGGLQFEWQTTLARQFEPLLDQLRRTKWLRSTNYE
jgi:hypothetical protein